MRHKHAAPTARRRRLPVLVGALATLGLVGATSLMLGGNADAAAPKKNYHPGKDTATFTVTGVLDANCLVSLGGNKVYIKPGDELDFKSSAAGVGIQSSGGGLLGGVTGLLTGSKLTGLRVSAYLDKGTTHQLHFNLEPGQTYKLKGLSKGSHSLAWTVTGVGVVGVGTVGTSSAQLRSGAKLDWAGGVYVSSGAPDCRLEVSTPNVHASAGPVHVNVPGHNVTLPLDPNKVVNKAKGVVKGVTGKAATKKTTTKPATTNNGSTGINSANGLLPVPARVVPGGSANGTYGAGAGDFGNGSTATGGSGGGGNGYAALSVTTAGGKTLTFNAPKSSGQPASNAASSDRSSSAPQLPIVLAIIAVVALALVGSTYTRLFLLRRRS